MRVCQVQKCQQENYEKEILLVLFLIFREAISLLSVCPPLAFVLLLSLAFIKLFIFFDLGSKPVG